MALSPFMVVARARFALLLFLMPVVLLTSGGIYTLTLLVSPGPDQMALWPPESTFVGFLMCGCLLLLLATSPRPYSDHCAFLLSLSVPDVVPPGPGLWKLNTSILSEDEYFNLIDDAWRNWRSSVSRFTSLA